MARPEPTQVTASWWSPGLLDGSYNVYYVCPHCDHVHAVEATPKTEYARVRHTCETTRCVNLVVTPDALREDAR